MKRSIRNNINVEKKKKAENEDNSDKPLKDGELGIIESVTVQNFMCHENLTLKFEPHLNFIIGQNGSGKSAILTAIILALGGKSSSTDRYKSIKGFVKSGKNKGKVEVVLRNRGSLAYKPDVYGEKIIITREFSKEGSSSYKIKTESGTVYSHSKSELNNIVEAMDIMVECPVSVLTQTTSKKFLISKDAKPERLFEFFYKGAGLEALDERYQSVNNTKIEAEAELDKKKQNLPDLKKDLKKWKGFLDSSKKISDYRNEMIWSNVIQMEKQVQEKKEELKILEEGLKEHKRIVDQCKKSCAEKKSEFDELNEEKNNLKSQMEIHRKNLENLKMENENLSSVYRRNKGTLRKLENDREKLLIEITDLEQNINDKKINDQRSMEEEEKRRIEAIQNLKEANCSLNDKLKNLEETLLTRQNEENNFGSIEINLRAKVNYLKQEIQNINKHLTAIRNAIRNKVNAFGEHTEKVLWDIKSMQNRFKKPPVGPIGMHMEMKDPRWAAAVEFATSSSLLNSFCVDNLHDSQILREILRKYYTKPPSIIVSQYESQIFDVQHGKTQSYFPTILDMLVIKNHLVANCLIDQALIERKILVENENAVVELMNKPPTNCYSAYFMNCDQISFNPSRMYSFGKRIPRSRLSAIRDEDIKNMEKDKEVKIAKVKEIEKTIETMKNAAESLPEKIKNLQHEVVKCSTEHDRNLMEIRELERKEETKNVDCLEEVLQTLNNSYEQKKEEIKTCSQVVSELESKKHELESKIDKLSGSLKSLNMEYCQRVLGRISEVSKLKESFETEKRKYEKDVKDMENRCKTEEKNFKAIQEQLETSRSNAESMCPRINTDRSSAEISRLISETERVVEAQSNCDRASLSQKYKEKKENLERAEMDLKRLEIYLTTIGEMLRHRKERFDYIRKSTQLVTNYNFTGILSGNGYRGFLQFNNTSKTLDLSVTPRNSDNTRKNHNSLSGGERSFVTIAFLLSLWVRTKMPFRILDEYDVFMDSSNRQLCVDLICQNAEKMPQLQFIFLSPLELARMPKKNYIHILKMAPPKRKAEDEENSPRKKRS